MAGDELVERTRAALAAKPVTEQKMFGGTCFMLAGNMLAAVSDRGLLVRVGKEAHAQALTEPHASTMEMRGRPMQGYIRVDLAGAHSDAALRGWLVRALAHVETLPAKAKKPKSLAKARTAKSR